MYERTHGNLGLGLNNTPAADYYVITYNPNSQTEQLWNPNLYVQPSAKEIINKANDLSSGSIVQDINDALNALAEAVTGYDFGDAAERNGINVSGSGSRSGSGSGSGSISSGTSSDMQSYIDMVNSITAKNNAWAADQAQKQMDFQERMARNAHTYEVEDLKRAGLNPVLSAMSGNGAATPSGAMAQPDTSNTRLLAEMALQSVDSLGNSAVNLASRSNSRSANSFADKLLKAAGRYVIPTLVKSITKGLM